MSDYKQNTKQLKKEWHDKCYPAKGEYWLPSWLDIWEWFLPHLISSDEEKIEKLIWEVISRVYSNVEEMGVPTNWNNEDFKRGALKVWEQEIKECATPSHDEIKREAAKIVEEMMEDEEHWGPIADRILNIGGRNQ